MPSAMAEYLENYGWHFSKKMCQWAVSRMKKADGQKIPECTKDVLEGMMNRYGVVLHGDKGYDAVYVANMCKADYLGSSVTDEMHMVRFVKDYIDDPDGYEGKAFTRFYADCIGTGTPIEWEDMI